MLEALVAELRQSLGILHKQDIQAVARFLGPQAAGAEGEILLGDDCAAIADGEGYLLLSAEGIMPAFLEADPWFAGWSAVMVNVSDIYAMGGRPIAVVDTLWSRSADLSQPLLAGMQAAARAYQVPIVGGHTNGRSSYNALSVAILGRARQLITSFAAQPGDRRAGPPWTCGARPTLPTPSGMPPPPRPPIGCGETWPSCRNWRRRTSVGRARTSAWRACWAPP